MPTIADLCRALDRAGVDAGLRPPSAGEVMVEGLTHDSRLVEPGVMFACLRGEHHDGHDHADTAVRSGAVALFDERVLGGAGVGAIPQLTVDDTRQFLGPLAAEVYGHPSRRLRTVGITGTNGKTTTAQMVATILEQAAVPCGIVGTLHGTRTTPEATDLQRRLADFVDGGLQAAVLEVSSHALELRRVDGTEFDVVAFTNLGRDHLDLHASHEAYFRAKSRLFAAQFAPVAVINVDDAHGLLLADALASDTDIRVVPYSPDDLDGVVVQADHLSFRWRDLDVEVPIGGRFNVSNALAALTIAVELGLEPHEAAAGLINLPRVPGRFEVVPDPRRAGLAPTVVVDYAHTPDGLEELLSAARSLVGDDGRLIAVFGCGGERDQAKRPEMGAVASSLAEVVVLTSDNPRHEDPERIIDDIQEGADAGYGARLIRNADRRAAIAQALELGRGEDVLVIAGKGHEQTQDLGSETIEFDDRSVVHELMEDRQ